MQETKKIFVLNGPNLNLLGTREPEVYGKETLKDIQHYIDTSLKDISDEKVELVWAQSNIEGEIVDKIQEAIKAEAYGIMINPGAYTHTSVAIYDALRAFNGKKVEVHLSNTNVREDFRKVRITSQAVDACIEGLGKFSYLTGLIGLLNI